VHVVGGVAAPYCLLYEVLDKILLEKATGMAGIVQSFTKRYRRANPNSLPFMSPSTLYGWFMSLYFLRWVDLREYNSSMPCGCTAGGFDCSMLVWDGIRRVGISQRQNDVALVGVRSEMDLAVVEQHFRRKHRWVISCESFCVLAREVLRLHIGSRVGGWQSSAWQLWTLKRGQLLQLWQLLSLWQLLQTHLSVIFAT
jgi:CRISPR-associated Cas5-like protein